MKPGIVRLVLLLFVLLPLPFVYNSCRGRVGTSASASASRVVCKLGLQKGELTPVKFDDSLPPAPFATTKVRLSQEKSSAVAKVLGPQLLNAGTHLGVIIDNRCLQAADSRPLITQAAAQSGELLKELDRQAYEWVLPRDLTDQEIEAQANLEPCVIGLSWNHDYYVQSVTFNDPALSQQAHLNAINALPSYDLFYGSPGGMAQTGNSVVVAVVDTGVDWHHPDLQQSLWTHSLGIGIDVTTVGTNLVDYNPFDASTNGHGTHVAGMIAATSNNGVGILGAMPYRAKIMAIKIFKPDGSGGLKTTSQYFYNAMRFAYLNGANVINLSLAAVSSGAQSDSLQEAGISEAIARGVTVVTVIGNADSGSGALIDGTSLSSLPGQFATLGGVIGVGSFDAATGAKSGFSHYSTTYAEVAAAGAENASTGLYSTTPTALGSYGRLMGTSQAAPQVSAAAALTIALIRNAYTVSPTPAEVERLIEESAIKSAQLNPYFKNGNRLDFLSLVHKINVDYPLTRTGGSAGLPQGCQ